MTCSPYSPTDYKTDLKPVWCPGCGDFAVLNSVYRALSELHIEPHQTAIVSGIGCSSRLPGYVETYGFNSLHGRALPLATGMKLAAPNLTVLAVGGDGDGLAIGGNHFMHAARRNVDIAYFMMDNEIYGLTKGQAAPTTPSGDRTKSTIYGNPEVSVDPCALAIALGASWVGRGFSGDVKGTTELMKLAISHHGFAFLNIISPCVTWRGDHQTKELRAKLAAIPADHDRSDRTAGLSLTSEAEHLTTGVLYETQRPTLIDEIMEIRDKAVGQAPPPGREEILRMFAPAM
ncbi:MAG: 2-oxoglutarate/2-oxoacid ferredoxin oxidoreductase subunit beta [Thermoanaerobaculia bacterium]|jgi:2-oxoglutarate ferredoxin oxidoreductase subunit beta|nr:2-oxoglutarate/2-oxoacid ferredoxin oxidoreductase subunit beta [Thermoanaerobaculia bacterium]